MSIQKLARARKGVITVLQRIEQRVFGKVESESHEFKNRVVRHRHNKVLK